MPYNPQIHHRQSIRLKGYNYSQEGAYFLTICTDDHICMFGDVVDGEMRLNDGGEFVKKCWDEIPEHYPFVRLDDYVVMPNHVHGILFIDNAMSVGANNHSPEKSTNDNRANNHSPLQTHQLINQSTNIERMNNHLPEQLTCDDRANDYSPLPKNNLLDQSGKSRPNGTSKTIGAVVRGFKIGVTKWYRNIGGGDCRGEKSFAPTITVWQRNYYEHIVRNDDELNRIRYYIVNNPAQWDLDKNNPKNL